MFNKEKIKGFVCGVCVASIISASTVFATNIDVIMGGIKVYWEGVEKHLTNAKGETVEPIIYEGTTYVPLRAMGNLMGKDVAWDQQTQSVYVGAKPVASTTAIEDFPKEKFQGNKSIYTGKDATYKFKDKTISCSNMMVPYATMILDGEYSKFVAKAVQPYESIGSSGESWIKFYAVTDSGEKTEIAKYDLKQTEEPVDVEVNLRGVTNLVIEYDYSGTHSPRLFDVSLLGK